MTATTIRPPRARRRSAPSARDQQIYLDYQTTGRSQEELAKDYKLTQCRISQIIRRVKAWLACGAGVSPADESAAIQNPKSEIQNQITADPAHLERALQRQYLAFVCREAIRQFQTDRVTTTTKTGTRGHKQI